MAEQDLSAPGGGLRPGGDTVVDQRRDPEPAASPVGAAAGSDATAAGSVTADRPTSLASPTAAAGPADPPRLDALPAAEPTRTLAPFRFPTPDPGPEPRSVPAPVDPLSAGPAPSGFAAAGPAPAGLAPTGPAPTGSEPTRAAAATVAVPLGRPGAETSGPAVPAGSTGPAADRTMRVTPPPGEAFRAPPAGDGFAAGPPPAESLMARPSTFRSATAVQVPAAPQAPAPYGGSEPASGTPGSSDVTPGWAAAPDEPWAARVPASRPGRFASRQAAGRSTPAHHVAAVDDGGRLVPVVSTVFAVLGSASVAAALYGADRSHGTARTLALAGAAVAAGGVVTAAGILLTRLAGAAGSQRRARRSAGPSLAGVLATVPGIALTLAWALIGAAAAVTVVGPAAPAVPRLTLGTVRADGGERTIRVDATVGGLAEGEPIAVSLSVVADGTTLLSSALQRASGEGADTVQLTGRVLDGRSVQVDVNLVGRTCRAVVPVRAALTAEDARVTCRTR